MEPPNIKSNLYPYLQDYPVYFMICLHKTKAIFRALLCPDVAKNNNNLRRAKHEDVFAIKQISSPTYLSLLLLSFHFTPLKNYSLR
jgi:hypothetical protein